MPNFEGSPPVRGHEEDFQKELERCPGLRQTLDGWCYSSGHDVGPLSFGQVVQILKNDSVLRKATKEFLTESDASQFDPEIAIEKREQLAWAILDSLSAGQ